MPRYINEDEFVAWVKQHWCADCNNDNGLRCRACWIDDAIDIVEEAPPADVVPKSEVAREIFEEIEKTIRAALILLRFSYKDNVKTKEIKEECYTDFLGYVAELKKKYTEEQT